MYKIQLYQLMKNCLQATANFASIVSQ